MDIIIENNSNIYYFNISTWLYIIYYFYSSISCSRHIFIIVKLFHGDNYAALTNSDYHKLWF